MRRTILPITFLLAACICKAHHATAAEAGNAGKVTAEIHVAGDWWEIQGAGSGAGMGTVQLEPGKAYTLKGLKGWSLELTADHNGAITLGNIDKGRMLDRIPKAAVMPQAWKGRGPHPVRVTLPQQHSIILDLHPAYGKWTIEGYPMAWIGRRTVFLPAGVYRVAGELEWSFDLAVAEGSAGAANQIAGLHGRTLDGLTADGPAVTLGPPQAARIVLAIPPDAGPYGIPGLLEPGSGNRAVWLPGGRYEIEGDKWSIAISVADTQDGAANGPISTAVLAPEDAGAVVGAKGNTLIWQSQAQPPKIAQPALHAFVQLGRTAFRRGENIRLSVVLKTPEKLAGRLAIRAVPADIEEGRPVELLADDWQVDQPRTTRTFDIDTSALSPAEYAFVATLGDLAANTAAVSIVRGMDERPTSYAICSYTHLDSAYAEKNLFNVDQPNHFGPHLLKPRVDAKSRERYLAAWSNPAGAPYEIGQNVPQTQAFLEDLTRHNLDAMLQYGCAHQYFHYGTCPADPHIRRAVGRGAALIVQAARNFEAFRAIVIGDEVGWPRWPDIWLDDTCPFCEQDFLRRNGRPVPRTTDDADAFRAWMLYKQTELADFFAAAGQRAAQVMPDVEINTQQGNLNLFTADGGYPPINQKPLTLSSAHWYPTGQGSLTPAFGHEFVRMGPRHIPYWPLVWTTNFGWDWMTGAEARHDIYLAASRQTEGVDHFAGYTAPKTPEFAEIIGGEVHPNLTRNGDMLLQLRRDTPFEVAVLYSFEEQHADCCFSDRIPYDRAMRHVNTVALAFFSLLRNHFPASIVTEEDVLAGKLRNRPALLVVGITRMRPDVKQQIEQYALTGKVFIDAETSVEIAGAQRIDCRFDALWRSDTTSTWPKDDKLYNDEPLRAVRKALINVVPRPVLAQSPLTITTRLKGGEGDYVWVVNDNVAMGSAAPGGKGFKAMPHADTITLPPAEAIYDVFSGRRLENPEIRLDLAPGDARLFACLPAAPARVNLTAAAGKIKGHTAIVWEANVTDANGRAIRAPVPVQVSVLGPSGEPAATLYRSTASDKPAAGSYILPLSPPAGAWAVRVICLLGGASSTAQVENAKPDAPGAFITEIGSVAPVPDAAAIKQTIAEAKAVYVVTGDAAFSGYAEEAAAAIRKLGMTADVRLVNEVRQTQLDRMFGYGMFRKWAPNIGGPEHSIDRPCVLIGTPYDNQLIADIMIDCEVLDQLVTPDYPGPGKGVVMHAWTPFSYTHNAVILSGSDANGIKRALAEFAQIVSKMGGHRDPPVQ